MSAKARKYYGVPVSSRLRLRVLARDSDTCRYCDFPADVVDHVVPRLAGGPNIEDNLVAACTPCNAIAGGLVFENFAEKREYILAKRRPQIVGRFRANQLRGHLRHQHVLDDGRFDDGQLDMLVEDLGFPPETPEEKYARWFRVNAKRAKDSGSVSRL